ncbi:hypothetical protein PISMIDRAFT_687421 [Pisolithus microcarpus 441]|uniref:Uncharacterized protein n=1 Tax=Pisolithus microcarpus 441 TaxID=765257 RepID=A0A0C9Z5N8_9AGAM|nr:hypothetical protein PISMIDRAFT_687421 [Pisolithus microcarpus 441]
MSRRKQLGVLKRGDSLDALLLKLAYPTRQTLVSWTDHDNIQYTCDDEWKAVPSIAVISRN